MKTCSLCQSPLSDLSRTGKCEKCRRKEYAREHRKKLSNDLKKKYRLKSRYGLTPEEFKALYEAQRGLCCLCLTQLEDPHVDHCHETGVVRGILCKQCNLGLGYFKDDPQRMFRAIEYLAHQTAKPLIGISIGHKCLLRGDGQGNSLDSGRGGSATKCRVVH